MFNGEINMSIFTKSLVNALVASIFIINAPLYAGEVEYVGETEKEKKVERRIEIKAKTGKPVRVFVDSDGQEHMFELSQQELNDLSEVNGKLQQLDRKTMRKVKEALANVSKNLEQLKVNGQLQHLEKISKMHLDTEQLQHEVAKLKELGKLQQVKSLEGLKELKVLHELMNEEHAVVIQERIHEQRRHADERELHERVYVIDGGEADIIISDEDNVKVRHLKIGRDNMVLKGHLDAILKLIEHGEFTPDELDKLQQMIDNKR